MDYFSHNQYMFDLMFGYPSDNEESDQEYTLPDEYEFEPFPF